MTATSGDRNSRRQSLTLEAVKLVATHSKSMTDDDRRWATGQLVFQRDPALLFASVNGTLELIR
ncbi:hypothetical protein, partial [Caballeronia grimmiae]|uniref:hypothetical protein n=1 Tax=Caballeronia grimmiae TaxID=1071679 RepID=UPI0019D3DF67